MSTMAFFPHLRIFHSDSYTFFKAGNGLPGGEAQTDVFLVAASCDFLGGQKTKVITPLVPNIHKGLCFWTCISSSCKLNLWMYLFI